MPESIYMSASLYDLIKMTVPEPATSPGPIDGSIEPQSKPESQFIEKAI